MPTESTTPHPSPSDAPPSEVLDRPPGGWLDGPPGGSLEIDVEMTNCGPSIGDGMADALREGGVYAKHAGWNFNGLVWFAAGKFHEQVWQHHVPQRTYSADTLEDLMVAVNTDWGWD